KIEGVAVGGVPGPGQDMVAVAPDEVGGAAMVVHHAHVRTIGGGGHHARVEGAVAEAPAVQKDEARAVRVEEQVVEVVASAAVVVVGVGNVDDFGNGEDQTRCAGFQIEGVDAGILGCVHV